MSYNNNIFDILKRLGNKNVEYFETLSEEQLKELQPLVLMRWMSGTLSGGQIVLLNNIVNPFVFSLPKHKMLLLYLLMISSFKGGRLQWKKPPKRQSKFPITVSALKQYYKYSAKQAEEVIQLHTNEQIMDIAGLCGFQKEELTELKKELSKRQ